MAPFVELLQDLASTYPEQYVKPVEYLVKLVKNVVEQPHNDKYLSVKLSNR